VGHSKTCLISTSSSTVSVDSPGNEPGSPRCEAGDCVLAQPQYDMQDSYG